MLKQIFSPNTRRIRKLKDRYKGERCFLVGNGPSLKAMDLTPLADEFVFATNMFVMHDDLETVRPDFYCLSDWVHWAKEYQQRNCNFIPEIEAAFARLPNTLFFFEDSAKYARSQNLKRENAFYIEVDGAAPIWDGHYNTDISRAVNWGKTVMLDFCVPVADYLGFESMYLIGNDYNWNLDKSANLGQGYFYDIKADPRGLVGSEAHIARTRSDEHVRLIMQSFEIVARDLNERGKFIYNAGIGGSLDVIPRVDFNGLF